MEIELIALVLMVVFGMTIAAAMIWTLLRSKRKG